jgi:hypothetical protein
VSRNLGRSNCRFCSGAVKCIESPRHVTVDDTSTSYFADCDGLIVARAECEDCVGKYLAWLSTPKSWGRYRPEDANVQLDEELVPIIRDLSFRSTFNDEPGEDDLPLYEIVVKRERIPIGPDCYWHKAYGKKEK